MGIRRQLVEWSHSIGIYFQLHHRPRLNLQKVDGQKERRKWLRGSIGEHEGAQREHIDETGFSGRAERRGISQQQAPCWPRFGEVIYIS